MSEAITRDALAEVIAENLRGTWHCNRVWEAWNVGTMGRDDFSPVDESETPYDVADAVLAIPEIAHLPELLKIARTLADLCDGLNNSNSSAEEAASRLADRAVKLVASLTGASQP